MANNAVDHDVELPDLTLWDELVVELVDESGYGSGAGYFEDVWPVCVR